MNDTFGNISQDFLPPGYGNIPSKVIQRVGEDAPTMEPLGNPDDYSDIFDFFKRDDTTEGDDTSWLQRRRERRAGESETTTATTEPTTGDVEETRERGAFWRNLGSMFKPVGSTSTSAGYCERKGKDAWTYHQYPDGGVVITAGPSHVGSTRHSATSAWGKGVKGMYGECDASTSSTTTTARGVDRVERGAAIGAGLGAFGAQLLPALASILGPQAITPLDDEFQDTSGVAAGGGTDWGIIIGGVAVLGMVGLGIFMATRDKDGE